MIFFDNRISPQRNRIAPQRKDCDCPCHLPNNTLPVFSTCGMVQCCYADDPDPEKSEQWTLAYLEQLRLDLEGPPPTPTLAERLVQYKSKKRLK